MHSHRRAPAVLAGLVLALAIAVPSTSLAQTKATVMIPMRDGTRLAADLYLPSEDAAYPVILARSPYDRAPLERLGTNTANKGYAMLIQSTRGRFGSEGDNLPFETDGWGRTRDGFDTLTWVRKQGWCNGKIGMLGGSALGITQYLAAGTGSEAITCQHITVGAPNLYGGAIYLGGIFRMAMIEDWLRGSQFSANALSNWVQHSTYDEYWSERDLTRRFASVNWPAVHIGGWYDIFAQGTLDGFVGYQYSGGPRAKGRQKLVMGPWTHGVFQEKAGELTFRDARKTPVPMHDSARFFARYLKGEESGVDQEPAVAYYVMGDTSDTDAPGNLWRMADKWPPFETRPVKFFFQSDRSLSQVPPEASETIEYTYDPTNPVPTIGGPQLTLPAGPMDQRKIESREDVVVFTTEPLSEPFEVTGRVRVRLYVSSDCLDTDFVARLCDVYPDGRSINVCEGALRARFRESFSRPKLLTPGRVYLLDLDLWSTSIIFNRGHRIRVHVTSSSSPGLDPNPNTGEPLRKSDRVRVAKNTLYLGPKHPAHILLPSAPSLP